MRQVTKPTFPTKEVLVRITEKPLPQALVRTSRWISDYYTTPLATVLSMILPRGIDRHRRTRIADVHTAIRTHIKHTPSAEQAVAISTIQTAANTTSLLFGPTGSGKTLIYKELAKQAVASGKSVIVLVPEIALTSQLVDEFMQDFPNQVLLTHSRQTEAERHITWKRALNTDTPLIAIGPRSALFLPLKKVGLVVVDEMHEPSYKQEQAPRYSALRVATILARKHGAKAVLGSATPPVAEYYAAVQLGVPIVRLPRRTGTTALHANIIDMTKRGNFTRHRFLSDTLLDAMQQTLDAKKQVLVFHNRRGSAAITLCEKCGWTATDPDTGVPLTLHSDTHTLVSHLTGYSASVPTACPVCHAADIIHKGIGTKLIESELSRIFPNKNIVRFDGDSGVDHSVDARYKELYDGEIDIIIGTQVVAKGIDLPHLETVGIVQADAGLALPDFTSSERVFQLISQAVGRVGRGHSDARIIVQSYQPKHPAVRYGVTQNYMEFYTQEVDHRQHYHFPPFSYLLKCTCTYKTESAAIRNTKLIAAELRKILKDDEKLLGPAPAFYEQKNGTFRWQIIVQSPHRGTLMKLANKLPTNGHWQCELDPGTLL